MHQQTMPKRIKEDERRSPGGEGATKNSDNLGIFRPFTVPQKILARVLHFKFAGDRTPSISFMRRGKWPRYCSDVAWQAVRAEQYSLSFRGRAGGRWENRGNDRESNHFGQHHQQQTRANTFEEAGTMSCKVSQGYG